MRRLLAKMTVGTWAAVICPLAFFTGMGAQRTLEHMSTHMFPLYFLKGAQESHHSRARTDCNNTQHKRKG
jgi:hypothetical protein